MADLPPDPDTPFPDAEVPDRNFDGLDLGTVADGVHATSAQWGDIATAAARRRQRRTWIIAAAALVVVLLGTSIVVLSRNGSDGGVQIAMGGTGSFAYVLPPEDPTEVQVFTTDPTGPSYAIQYVDLDGTTMLVTSQTFRDLDPGGSMSAATFTENLTTNLAGRPLQIEPLGTVYLACAMAWQAESTSNTGMHAYGGPPSANLVSDQGLVLIRRVTMEAPGAVPCDPPLDAGDPIVDHVQRLRVVGADDWQAFLDEHLEITSATTAVGPMTVDPLLATTTTVSEEPPADRASAEEEIAAAVASLTDSAKNESFPFLEDGVAKAQEYRDMFATAGRQAGAVEVEGDPVNVFSLASLHFTSPERASIVMDMQVRLPSGRYQFSQDGEVFLQDGRWVISYETITRMLGRACLPPAGVSSECRGG